MVVCDEKAWCVFKLGASFPFQRQFFLFLFSIFQVINGIERNLVVKYKFGDPLKEPKKPQQQEIASKHKSFIP